MLITGGVEDIDNLNNINNNKNVNSNSNIKQNQFDINVQQNNNNNNKKDQNLKKQQEDKEKEEKEAKNLQGNNNEVKLDYAYVTFVNNDDYAKGVLALKQSLDDTKTPYNLVVLITEKISADTIDRLVKLGCLVETVKPIEVGKDISVQIERWLPAFTKFKAWQMTKYARIIWLDSDMLVLKSLDHLFDYIDQQNEPETIYATVDADADSCEFKPQRLKLINSGLVVLAPKLEVYDRLVSNMKVVAKKMSVINDQDVINYTLTWKALEYPVYGVQVTHCECNDPRLWDYSNTNFLHFTAGLKELPKPWRYSDDMKLVNVPDCVKSLYKTWQMIYNKALDKIDGFS